MLDFFCPRCGAFTFEDLTCTCNSAAAAADSTRSGGEDTAAA